MTETFQITREQAEAYEARFVPALFGEWAPRLCDAAQLRPGEKVLDVACGTGVVAREACDRVGASGRVVGLDLNPAMLEVATRVALSSRGGRATSARCRSPTASSTSCSVPLPCSSSPT